MLQRLIPNLLYHCLVKVTYKYNSYNYMARATVFRLCLGRLNLYITTLRASAPVRLGSCVSLYVYRKLQELLSLVLPGTMSYTYRYCTSKAPQDSSH